MTIIDAHQHVWDLDRAAYPWLTPEAGVLHRSFSFEEVLPALRRAGVDATVLVEAADNDDDTDLMRAVADAHPEVVAIVAYLPLERPDAAADRLDVLRGDPRLVGARTLIHNEPDPDWLLRPAVDESLGMLERAGLTFDVVAVLPRHLEVAAIVAERHPELRIVIDHLGHPPIGAGGGEAAELEPWSPLLAAAAAHPLVHAKVSGLYSTVGDPASWTADGIRPFVERALELFGSDRLMYGGDWPVSEIAGGYDRTFAALGEMFGGLAQSDRDALLGGTAERFYRIDPGLLAAARRTGTTA